MDRSRQAKQHTDERTHKALHPEQSSDAGRVAEIQAGSTAARSPGSPTGGQVLALQHTVGNRAVQSLVASKDQVQRHLERGNGHLTLGYFQQAVETRESNPALAISLVAAGASNIVHGTTLSEGKASGSGVRGPTGGQVPDC